MAIAHVLLVAACGQAGAVPAVSSGLAAPPGWKALPALAAAVAAGAKGTGVTVEGVEAWGEPARGCYATWLALRGDGATADQVLAGLGGERLLTSNVVKPDGADGLVALTFETGPEASPSPQPTRAQPAGARTPTSGTTPTGAPIAGAPITDGKPNGAPVSGTPSPGARASGAGPASHARPSAGAPATGTRMSDGAAAAHPAPISGTYRGRLRARIAAGKITALACFANEREPATCEGPCTALLGGLP